MTEWKPGLPGFIAILLAVVVGAIASIALIGIMFEGVSRHWEELDRCRKSASTPYEYHRCR